MMTDRESLAAASANCVLRFQPLVRQGSALVFPCDELGNVRLDSLERKALSNYLYARRMIGRQFTQPRVISVA